MSTGIDSYDILSYIKEGFPNKKEKFPQMSSEDIEEMRAQIPILKEMLNVRKLELARLENSSSENEVRISKLKEEIVELEFEITGREN